MKIESQCVVSIHYTVSSNGMEVDSSRDKDPLTYMHGTGGLIPGLENALEGSAAGDSLVVDIKPEDAYGPVNEELIQQVPITAFDGVDKVESGMQFQATGNNGAVQNIIVVGVEGDVVTIDANHPLAGQELHFEVEVANVREATSEELQQS